MERYDILKDTWIYQEIRQQVIEEQQQVYITEQHQIVQDIVQARFPSMETLLNKAIKSVADPTILRKLLVQMSTVRTEKEARHCLTRIDQTPELE